VLDAPVAAVQAKSGGQRQGSQRRAESVVKKEFVCKKSELENENGEIRLLQEHHHHCRLYACTPTQLNHTYCSCLLSMMHEISKPTQHLKHAHIKQISSRVHH